MESGQQVGPGSYNFIGVLSRDMYSKLMLAESGNPRRLYAVKVLKKKSLTENDDVAMVKTEKRVFLTVNRDHHPFLTDFHGCFQTDEHVYFATEYLAGGNLMFHLQHGEYGHRHAKFYGAEMCLALKYLHERGILYRNLTLESVLLTREGHIKLTNFGLCKEEIRHGSSTSTFCGTFEFMPPEMLRDESYGLPIDWWCFGVLIYQLLLKQAPFQGEDEEEIYEAILNKAPTYPPDTPEDAVSILQKLTDRNPDQRLGSGPTDAQEVMSQPFFRDIVWDDVYNKRVPPPFVPTIQSEADTSNFDVEFTSVSPVLTPVRDTPPESTLSQTAQDEWRDFDFTVA